MRARRVGRATRRLVAPIGAAGFLAFGPAGGAVAPFDPQFPGGRLAGSGRGAAEMQTPPRAPAREPQVYDAVVVARYPHDPDAFTQGLIWLGGHLYESVGQLGRSEVRRVSLADGRVLARSAIPASQFGEGLAAHGGELVSLTWQDGVAYRWDPRTLRRRGISRYPGEGWGLASDGRRLILSDGTPTLRFLDPETFAEQGRVAVTLRGRPLRDLNELEWIDGALWANVWHQPVIVRIDPVSGAVTGIVDLRPTVRELGLNDPEAVANGIAWDAGAKRLFVTGKLWPKLYEIRLEEARR